MERIYYLMEEPDVWVKLWYLPEESALDDMFELCNDCEVYHSKKGTRMSMYYGSMMKLIEQKKLLTEIEWMKKQQ